MKVLQKIYIILGKQTGRELDSLCSTLSALFPYLNFTSNLYLVTKSLPQATPEMELILKHVSNFLKENLFARLYVHLVHPAPQTGMKDMDFCLQNYYQPVKAISWDFDHEGYIHQEVPRLILLPVIVPDNRVEPLSLRALLGALNASFLPPTLYLHKSTFFLAHDKDLMARAEKVYYGCNGFGESSEIACALYCNDILDEMLDMLQPEALFTTGQCPAAVIISADDGMVYPCMEAFLKGEGLGDIYADLDGDKLMDLYHGYREQQKECLMCRERVVDDFSDLSLPEAKTLEVGALLYRFGVFNQDADKHIRAIENFRRSLILSPAEEAGSINFRIGFSYIQIGEYDRAHQAFERAEPTFHDQYFLHFYLGLCYFQKEDYDSALEKFSRAASLKPEKEELVNILIYLGTCHNRLGDYQRAVTDLETAKDLAGFDVKEIYSTLGFSYFQLKDYDRAIENLSMAVEIDPDSAIDFASLGSNYREKGSISMAIAMYEKALKLDPTLIHARQNLERLQNI